MELVNFKYEEGIISHKRLKVYELFLKHSINIKSNDVKSIAPIDLDIMFRIYDLVFLGSWFKEKFKGKIKFSLSKRMTRSAGMTIYPKNLFKLSPSDIFVEIRIGVDFLFRYNLMKSKTSVCGIKVDCSLLALMLIFEHELVHCLEVLNYGDTNCTEKRFKLIANNLFLHSESYHHLPTQIQLASKNMGINIGDNVKFMYEGEKLAGFIHAINKRATVLVKDSKGSMMDKKGNRYIKYYIPLSMLEISNFNN